MSRLDKFVSDLCVEIKNISSETKLSVSYEPFEDVDATIRVYPPTEEAAEQINNFAVERTLDILWDEGYNISVLVFEPDEEKMLPEDLTLGEAKG
ncbi:MAG: hypothetical protein ACUVV0_10195 [Anaerolineae bacterium]